MKEALRVGQGHPGGWHHSCSHCLYYPDEASGQGPHTHTPGREVHPSWEGRLSSVRNQAWGST